MAESGYSQSPEKSSPREEQATPYPQQRAWALSVPGNSLEGKERREGEEKGRWERGTKVEEEGEEKEKARTSLLSLHLFLHVIPETEEANER